MRSCSKCGGQGPFYPDKHFHCQECRKKAARRAYHVNKAADPDINRKRHTANPARQVRTVHRAKYGVTLEWRQALELAQRHTCAICGNALKRNRCGTYGHLDHDHATGRVRAVLCSGCNTTVGVLEKSSTLAALEYLEKHKCEKLFG